MSAAKTFYDAALSALGYRCLSEDVGSLGYGSKTVEGKPGPRPDYGPDYYAAFLKDPDGFRIEAYCHGSP